MSTKVRKVDEFYQKLSDRRLATASKQLINAGVNTEKLKPEHIKVYSEAVRSLEKIKAPRCYVNPYVAQMIDKGCSADELETFLSSAIVHSKRNWNLSDLSKAFNKLLEHIQSKDEWEISKEVLNTYVNRGWCLTPLVNVLTKLVSAKPKPTEWELYKDILAYSKKNQLSDLVETTGRFADIVEVEFSENELKQLKELVEYQKNLRRNLSGVIHGFYNLTGSRPNEEAWEIFNNLINYYKTPERKWDIGPLMNSFAELALSKPTKDDLEVYIKALENFKEYDFNINNFTSGFAGLVAFKAPLLIFELFITASTFHSKFEEDDTWEFINGCCIGLATQNPPRATIRNYIQAVKDGHIKTAEDSKRLLGEIAVHSSICSLVKSTEDEVKDSARETIMYIGDSDSPPYVVYDEKRNVNPQAQKTYGETLSVYRRAVDAHHGFSALTFDTKRSPTKEPALLARFGKDVARSIEYINARDINQFPGRGFVISGLMPERVFVPDEIYFLRGDDPFQKYKSAWSFASEVFDDLPKTKFIFTRGFIAISCEGSKYKLKDVNGREVNYSYVVFNDHHHNYDNNVAFLVPTEVLDKKLKDVTIPYGDYVGPSTKYKDVNEVSIKIEDLILDARVIPANVLNLGWGSNIGGGLCNAYPPSSSPFHLWEKREIKQEAFTDFYGHVHKSYINGVYEEKMTRKHERRLSSLREAHNQVYQVTNSYQNLLDLFRIAFALWHKGQTLGEEISPFDESLDNLFERPKPQIEEQPFIKSSTEDASLNINSLRMLTEAYKWHQASEGRKFSKNDFPVLVTARTLNWWTKPDSPFYLDTFDMTISLEDKEKISLPQDSNGMGFDEAFTWTNHIMPYAMGAAKDLRFYDRRDLGIE